MTKGTKRDIIIIAKQTSFSKKKTPLFCSIYINAAKGIRLYLFRFSLRLSIWDNGDFLFGDKTGEGDLRASFPWKGRFVFGMILFCNKGFDDGKKQKNIDEALQKGYNNICQTIHEKT